MHSGVRSANGAGCGGRDVRLSLYLAPRFICQKYLFYDKNEIRMYDSRDTGQRAVVDLSGRTIEEIATRTADIVIQRMDGAKAVPKSELLLSTRTAAKLLGLTPATLRRRVLEYPHKKINGRYYFPKSEIEKLTRK